MPAQSTTPSHASREYRAVQQFAFLALLIAGCSDERDPFACELPDRTQYGCEPLPTGAYGCIGGPKWVGRVDNEAHQDDPDATFPVGCHAQIPDCSGYYRGSLRSFECAGNFADPPNDAGIDSRIGGPAYWGEAL